MISADLSGIGNYIGSMEGLISAIKDPRVQGDFLGSLMNKTRKAFYVESLAAVASGSARIKHVYEWGEEQGEVSSIRLYALTKHGDGGTQFMSYHFLPSTKFVPLPDAARYGFPATSKTGKTLSRHVFTMKALVMETKDKVEIKPVRAKALFIPTHRSPKGFIMSSKGVTIAPGEMAEGGSNPGGKGATGGFASWWAQWFSTRAHEIAKEHSKESEKVIASTGQKLIRYAAGTKIGGRSVGGQFASGQGVSYGHINAVKQNAELEAKNTFKRIWEDEGGDEE